jgi:hypothetical protein
MIMARGVVNFFLMFSGDSWQASIIRWSTLESLDLRWRLFAFPLLPQSIVFCHLSEAGELVYQIQHEDIRSFGSSPGWCQRQRHSN